MENFKKENNFVLVKGSIQSKIESVVSEAILNKRYPKCLFLDKKTFNLWALEYGKDLNNFEDSLITMVGKLQIKIIESDNKVIKVE